MQLESLWKEMLGKESALKMILSTSIIIESHNVPKMDQPSCFQNLVFPNMSIHVNGMGGDSIYSFIYPFPTLNLCYNLYLTP